ncbi:MAG: threonine-phosphate decarboxylase CobD [Acidaminococcaceae bacterium]
MYTYVHGGDIYSETSLGAATLVDFSANINPLGMPTAVKKALRQAAGQCASYPDPFCRRLTARLATEHGVNPEQIFLDNGAAAVLFRLALALKPRRALLLAPTFADYEKALRTVDCQMSYYQLAEQRAYCVEEDILAQITPEVDLLVICNPNNPTGQVTTMKLLRAILEKCQQTKTLLLVDECFMDFVEERERFSLLPYLARYENLIILKAFTKTYAMAGVRLGYCLAHKPEIIEACHLAGQDWGVSTLAQAAGLSALEQKEYLASSQVYIKAERAYLLESLARLKIKTYGSLANYIFFTLPQVTALATKLKTEGFLIRECANYHNLDNTYYRIAVRTKTQNKLLIKALRKILQHEITIGNN